MSAQRTTGESGAAWPIDSQEPHLRSAEFDSAVSQVFNLHGLQRVATTSGPAKHARALSLILTFLFAGLALFTGCERQNTSKTEETLYTCGMHPQVIQNKPGNCPICGMKLTPIRKQPGSNVATTNALDAGNSMDSSVITLDSATVQNMGLLTGLITRGPLYRTVRTVGTVDFDEASLAEVTTKFKGWIEKLYVDYTGQQVHRGEPLFEVYSPDLYSAETEYVLAMNETVAPGGVGADLIRKSALDKLRYFDISEQQIAELEKTRQVKKTLQVTAPRDGIVVEKTVVEGQMVDAGVRLYRLADLGTVWVQSQVYEQDLPFVSLGQEATVSLSYLPDRKFRGRVTFLYPTVDDKTRTARVRMEFHNPGFFLKPGMFATVELRCELSPSALLVPDSAVLRSGEKNIVFVRLARGAFEPRMVTIGARGEDNSYEVLSGLNEGDRVVTSGQFLLDSESQLREAIQKMRNSGEVEKTAGAAPEKMAAAPQSSTNAPALPSAIKYICPMPEHVAIEYDTPGKCPLCGMTLVPVSMSALRKIQPGGQVLYYTCPMPEHSDVRSDKPGKCNKCGMTLIPIMNSPAITNRFSEANPTMPQALPALFTCPMAAHADVVSDKPGKCPKCDMELVPVNSVPHGKTAEENWRKQHTPTAR